MFSPQEFAWRLRYKKMMQERKPDQDLAAAAAQGDAGAFSALLQRHYDRIFGLTFRLTGNRAEAEDLTQDICAALPDKMRGYQPSAPFTTWLYRVVVNAAHDRRRRQATQARAAAGWGDWERNRQAAMADTHQQIDWLTRAMSALPEDLRDTLALVLDDMTQADVAEVLGIAPGTVSWRISEAKARLRSLKEQEGVA